MKRKLLISLILALACLMGCFVFACSCDSDGEPGEELTPPKTEYSIELNKYSTTLGIGGDFLVMVRTPLKDTEYTFNSNNVAVATVSSDGLIKAVGVGTATVTVACTHDGENKSAKFEVTVEDLGELPVIEISSLDEYIVNLLVGSELDFAPVVKFRGSEVTSDSQVSVTVGTNGVLSYADNKLTANAIGVAEVTVTAVYNGVTVNKNIQVNVISDTVVLTEITRLELVTSKNGVKLTNQPVEMTINTPVVYKDGVEQQGATFEWATSDDSVVTVDQNGKATSVGAGKAVISVTASVSQVVIGDALINVSVVEPYLEAPTNARIENGKFLWDKVDFADKYIVQVDSNEAVEILVNPEADSDSAQPASEPEEILVFEYSVKELFGKRALTVKAVAAEDSGISDSKVVEVHGNFTSKNLTARAEAFSERFKNFEATVTQVTDFDEHDVYYANLDKESIKQFCAGYGKVFNLVYYTATVAAAADKNNAGHNANLVWFHEAESFIYPNEAPADYYNSQLTFWVYTYGKANTFYLTKSAEGYATGGTLIEKVDVPADTWTKVSFTLTSGSFTNLMFSVIAADESFYYTDVKIVGADFVEDKNFSNSSFYVGRNAQSYIDELPDIDSNPTYTDELANKIMLARSEYDLLTGAAIVKDEISIGDYEKLVKLEKAIIVEPILEKNENTIEASDGEWLMTGISKIIEDAESLASMANLYSQTDKANLKALQDAYVNKFIMATDISSADIILPTSGSKYSNNGYDSSINLSKGYDAFSPTTQVLNVVNNGNNHVAFEFTPELLSDIWSELLENKFSTVTFYIRTSEAKSFWLGTEDAKFISNRYESNARGVFVETLANEWTEISLTYEQFLEFNGIISRTSVGEITIELSNVYIIKANDVESVIEGLPEIVDLTMTDGERIHNAYNFYTESGKQIDESLVTRLNNIKTAYDAKWTLATNISENDIVEVSTANATAGYDATISVKKGYNKTYGVTQSVTATKALDTDGNTAFNLIDATLASVKTAMTDRPNSIATFYIKSDKTASLWLGSESAKYMPEANEQASAVGKKIDVYAGNWMPVRLTASEWNAFNGIISGKGIATINLSITNVFVLSPQLDVETLIKALPDVSEVKLSDYSKIMEAYKLYNALPNGGAGVDGNLKTKLSTLKTALDKEWMVASENASDVEFVKDTTSDVKDKYQAQITVTTEYDSVYGYVQKVVIKKDKEIGNDGDPLTADAEAEKPEETIGYGKNWSLDATAMFDSIKALMAEDNTIYQVKFFAKGSIENEKFTFTNSAYNSAFSDEIIGKTGTSNQYEFIGHSSKLFTATTAWTEYTISKAEINSMSLDGFIRGVGMSVDSQTFYFSNFYLVKLDPAEIVGAINALPEADAVDMFDGEAIANAYALYLEAKTSGINFDTAIETKMTAVKAAYDEKYVIASNVATDSIVEADPNGSSHSKSGYTGKVTLSTEQDAAYGTVQIVNIKGAANNAFGFSDSTIQAVKDALSANPGATVELYVQGKSSWYLGNSEDKYYDKSTKEERIDFGDGSTWTKITFTKSEFEEFNCFIFSKAWTSGDYTFKISNFYIVKFDATEVVNAINALPEANAVEMQHGEQIKNVYNLFTDAKDYGFTFDAEIEAKINDVKRAYDAKWVMVTDIATSAIVSNRSIAFSGTYDNYVAVTSRTDETYGTVQAISITRPSVNTGHTHFAISAFSAIATELAKYPGATVEFYIKDNVGSHNWWFGTANKQLVHNTYDGADFAGKSITLGTADTWTKISFTADELNAFLGDVTVLDKRGIANIEISNFYIVKAV